MQSSDQINIEFEHGIIIVLVYKLTDSDTKENIE